MSKPENQKEMFARFGLAAYHAQCFEAELGVLLVLNARAQNKNIKHDEVLDIDEWTTKKTLGQLLKEVRKIVNFDAGYKNILNKALNKRNYLMHSFFKDHYENILSNPGQKKMIEELTELSGVFSEADAMVQVVSKTLAKVAGITDDLVDKEFSSIKKRAGII